MSGAGRGVDRKPAETEADKAGGVLQGTVQGSRSRRGSTLRNVWLRKPTPIESEHLVRTSASRPRRMLPDLKPFP